MCSPIPFGVSSQWVHVLSGRQLGAASSLLGLLLVAPTPPFLFLFLLNIDVKDIIMKSLPRKSLISMSALAFLAAPVSAFAADADVPPDAGTSTEVPAEPTAEPAPADPTDPAPVDPTPVDPTPVDPTPVDPTPVDPAPVDPSADTAPGSSEVEGADGGGVGAGASAGVRPWRPARPVRAASSSHGRLAETGAETGVLVAGAAALAGVGLFAVRRARRH